MKKTVIYSDHEPHPADRTASHERERHLERSRREAAVRSVEYRPRRRWPGLLFAGLFGAAVGAVLVSNHYDDRTFGQRVDATLQAAQTSVESGVESMRSNADEAVTQTADSTGRAAGSVAATMGDVGITAAVKSSLATDPDLSALAIDVTTKDGVVTLEGPAPDDAARERAATLASATDGVRSVDNRLAVAAATAAAPASSPSGS